MKKPAGRLARRYRIMWDQNHPYESMYNPPMAPEMHGAGHLGYFVGTPVDACTEGIGPDAGYVTAFPSQKTRMEYLVERYERGATLGDVRYWRHAENLKRTWAAGHDPLGLQVEEAQRLGIDFWFRLSMNDWHHVSNGKVYRLGGSRFYEERTDLLIGEEGAAGWKDHPATQSALTWMQDFAHEEVRALRRDIALEVCERYDCAGFVFDFIRIPGYFRYGEERRNAHLLTQMVRETRAGLDEIGRTKGREIGLAVRLPATVDGTRRLGIDIEDWIDDHLVDIVVTSPFFPQDFEHDAAEWVALARSSPVHLQAAIEEGYQAGHNDGHNRWWYDPPLMTPMSLDMVRGMAARHHRAGVDGLYVFNWFGTLPTYDQDLVPALDEIADPERLRYLDKRYLVMRSTTSFPNCLDIERTLPLTITGDPAPLTFDIVDDVAATGDVIHSVRLLLHVANPTIEDEMEVCMEGPDGATTLPLANPMEPGVRQDPRTAWFIYDLRATPPRAGVNRFTVRASRRNQRTADELPLTVEDAELEIAYEGARIGRFPAHGTTADVPTLGLPVS